jgi:hypothetical protein
MLEVPEVVKLVAPALMPGPGRHRPVPSRLRRSPPSYSTVPLRLRLSAALSVSHGDRRMRGSSPLNPTPRDQQPIRLPRKLGQAVFRSGRQTRS